MRILAAADGADRLDGGGAQGRRQSEQHGDRQRQGDAEGHLPPTGREHQLDGIAGHMQQGHYPGRGPRGEQHPQGRGDAGDERALHQHQLDQPPLSGADGDAQGHLARPRGGPGGHQVARVGAGQQEHQEHQSRQDQQRAAVFLLNARIARGGRIEQHPPAEIRPKHLLRRVPLEGPGPLLHFVGIGGLQRLADLLERISGLRPHPDMHPAPSVVVQDARVHRVRDEHVRKQARLGAGESFRRHSYNFELVPAFPLGRESVRFLPHAECLPQDVRIAGEAARPVVVAENGYRLRAGRAVVIERKQTAQCRPQAENAKHIPEKYCR